MKKYLIAIIAVSLATHFAFFGWPDSTVFDEVHFGRFVSGYYTGEYFFDIHPPLGKLIIAGFAKFFDFQPEYSFAEIGAGFPDKKYMALRFLPSLAGALLAPVMFLLMRRLGLSNLASFSGALLVSFENALLTQSRFILLDAFLLLFGFASLLFYFRYRQEKTKTRDLVLMAVFGGLAVSVKWTGASFLALPVIVEFYERIIKEKRLVPFIKFCSFFIISAALYFSIFLIHFGLLAKPGSGDAFMSPEFRTNNSFSKFVELNEEMYSANQRLTATHPYSSQWFTWPLMSRPIFYWIKGDARIYLIGNPAIWWATAAAVAIAIGVALSGQGRRLWLFLLGGYFLNLLPFIGVKRVMFLYHYFASLLFAIIILAYLIDKTKNPKRNFAILLSIAFALFLWFAPLTYGLPLPGNQYELRTWLPGWK